MEEKERKEKKRNERKRKEKKGKTGSTVGVDQIFGRKRSTTHYVDSQLY